MNSQSDEDASMPLPIKQSERLGRRVKDEVGKKPRNLNRISNRIRENIPLPYQEFLTPTKSPLELSVDRIDQAPSLSEINDIALRNAESENKIFQGWLTVISKYVKGELNFSIHPCPDHQSNPPNLYHANIIFPGTEKEAARYRKARAQVLAANAKWLPCPK